MRCFSMVGFGCGSCVLSLFFRLYLHFSAYHLCQPLSVGWPGVFRFCCLGPAGDLSIVVALLFTIFYAPSCMMIINSYFWSDRRFVSHNASCLAVCLLLTGPCQWSGCCCSLGCSVLYGLFRISILVWLLLLSGLLHLVWLSLDLTYG